MARIIIQQSNVKYDNSTKTFSVGGIGIPFGTKHEIYNALTTLSKYFEFSNSTGSEWDPTTLWIYKSEDGYTLQVGNEDVTSQQARNYYDAKMR